ncbi:hypothetical protein [Fulvimarina sp. MAC8]|uniref:hypothetical protein n=1 Tax=Fulvimarina sp. MAC8 TaxID=3162874 RepID=UPI0032EEEF54
MTIASFWLATVLGELFGSTQTVIAVKTTIPWGFMLLMPALAATGGTGFNLSGRRRPRLITTKIRRTVVSAANGLIVLLPSALFLACKAWLGEFDASFDAVQALELCSGAVNITLLGLNMRDGFKMKGRFRHHANAHQTITRGA